MPTFHRSSFSFCLGVSYRLVEGREDLRWVGVADFEAGRQEGTHLVED